MTLLYLAGPMSGIPEFNYPAFHQAEDQLRQAGYDVVSPAVYNIEGDLPPYETMLAEQLKRSIDCDGIAVLPGWVESRGARLEVTVAQTLRRTVLQVDEWINHATGKTA